MRELHERREQNELHGDRDVEQGVFFNNDMHRTSVRSNFAFYPADNVDFTVTVTDTQTGVVKEYKNPANNPAQPVQDTFTFACNP